MRGLRGPRLRGLLLIHQELIRGQFSFPSLRQDNLKKRRIYTEEKAKVVAAVWRIELFHFLAALGRYEEEEEIILLDEIIQFYKSFFYR